MIESGIQAIEQGAKFAIEFPYPQLHQLRGRIGRGKHQSHCWLLCDRYPAEESYARIRFFAENTDGFALAEEDLRLRGPGDAWGVRQHGAPGCRLAYPLRGVKLVRLFRDDARQLLEKDPLLIGARGQNSLTWSQLGFRKIHASAGRLRVKESLHW